MTLREVSKYIISDLYRYTGRITVWLFFRNFLFNRSFKYSFWFRLCKHKNPFIRFIARVNHRYLSIKLNIEIPAMTEIGYGLYLSHGTSIIINGTAKIGSNVNLSQFTTIGANENQAATIGDNVYIGPNVCLVENINIGNNVTIGAGAVVIRSISDNLTAAGVPAKIVSSKEPARYIKNRWK